MFDFKGKTVLILGLGTSGVESAKFLLRKGAKIKITEGADNPMVHKRLSELKGLDFIAEVGGHTAEFFKNAYAVVVSPGVNINDPVIRRMIPPEAFVVGELELGFMFCKAPVIAITGTNGKSTTTELIGDIMVTAGKKTAVCGNIGIPFISKAEELDADSVAVVEVSSFQLETIRTFKPKVAILLNITEDHYERHGNFENYKIEKFKVFANQDKDDVAVLYSDFRNEPLLSCIKSKVVYFGDAASSIRTHRGDMVDFSSGEPYVIMKVDDMPIKGIHNMENVASSIIAARAMGVGYSEIVKAVKAFSPLSHRFQTVGVFGGIEFIDDSKATNIDATKRALESLTKKAVLIAGGIDKGGDYTTISGLVRDKVSAMVLIGQAKDKIRDVFQKDVPVFMADTMKDAVKLSAEKAKQGEAVLLAPMCSSFDMFSGYKERGDVFKRSVMELYNR